MTQFCVYKNPSKHTSKSFPYLIDIQSNLLADLTTRIVIPLSRQALLRNQTLTRLTPVVTYNGDDYLLMTPQISSLPANVLSKPIGTLAQMRDDIIAAIDFSIAGV